MCASPEIDHQQFSMHPWIDMNASVTRRGSRTIQKFQRPECERHANAEGNLEKPAFHDATCRVNFSVADSLNSGKYRVRIVTPAPSQPRDPDLG